MLETKKPRYISDIVIVATVFMLGVLYYYMFREQTIVAKMIGVETLNIFSPYKIYFNWFPSFVHTFVFIYITWLVFDKQYCNLSILIWSIINIVCELMQGKEPIITTTWLPSSVQELCNQSTLSLDDIISVIIASVVWKVFIHFNKS